MHSSVANFTLLPVPMFILMGEILWQSKVVFRAMDVIDGMLGRLPGRLSVLTLLSGTVFSALSGSTMANTAMLGSVLLPEMERRGYHRSMSLGPIMKGGGLAMIIPPSGLAVILSTVANISIGQLLIACIVPGLIMAVLYIGYVIIRCKVQPSLTDAGLCGRAANVTCAALGTGHTHPSVDDHCLPRNRGHRGRRRDTD
jgi:TRAP-type C4-dicarboxylate transport system permease large subunit